MAIKLKPLLITQEWLNQRQKEKLEKELRLKRKNNRKYR